MSAAVGGVDGRGATYHDGSVYCTSLRSVCSAFASCASRVRTPSSVFRSAGDVVAGVVPDGRVDCVVDAIARRWIPRAGGGFVRSRGDHARRACRNGCETSDSYKVLVIVRGRPLFQRSCRMSVFEEERWIAAAGCHWLFRWFNSPFMNPFRKKGLARSVDFARWLVAHGESRARNNYRQCCLPLLDTKADELFRGLSTNGFDGRHWGEIRPRAARGRLAQWSPRSI